MLPDRDPLLGLLDKGNTGIEGLLPMTCARSGDQSRFADRDGSVPVGDGNRDHLMPRGHLSCYFPKDFLGPRMRLIGKRDHAASVIVIPNIPGENHAGSSRWIGHRAAQGISIDGVESHPHVPNRLGGSGGAHL